VRLRRPRLRARQGGARWPGKRGCSAPAQGKWAQLSVRKLRCPQFHLHVCCCSFLEALDSRVSAVAGGQCIGCLDGQRPLRVLWERDPRRSSFVIYERTVAAYGRLSACSIDGLEPSSDGVGDRSCSRGIYGTAL
jgi:hypothetical protein